MNKNIQLFALFVAVAILTTETLFQGTLQNRVYANSAVLALLVLAFLVHVVRRSDD